MKNPLTHDAEAWLYFTDPTAWGYLKAMQHEPDQARVGAIKALLSDQVRASIAEAYRRMK